MRVLLTAGLLTLISACASSAVAQSCRANVVGRWSWTSSTGINAIIEFQDNDNAPCSGNAFCTRGGAWRCQGNSVTYNNGMYDTTLTMSADLMTMSGVGGFPPNPQTVVRLGAPPRTAQGALVDRIIAGRRRTNAGLDDAPAPVRTAKAETNSTPSGPQASPESSPNKKYGDIFMKKGQRFLQKSNEVNLRLAANEFRGAAEFYAQASELGLQRKAIAAADAADADADRLERERVNGKKRGRETASCAFAKDQIEVLRSRGGNVNVEIEQLRQKLAQQGCNVL